MLIYKLCNGTELEMKARQNKDIMDDGNLHDSSKIFVI